MDLPDGREYPSEHDHMPLLRSLASYWARAAINMSLLTELDPLPHLPRNIEMRVRSSEDGRTPLNKGRMSSGSLPFGHFPNHLFGSFIFPQTLKTGVAQVAAFGPFGEMHFADQFRC